MYRHGSRHHWLNEEIGFMKLQKLPLYYETQLIK